MEYIQQRIRHAASKRILLLPHAIAQMSRPDRMILAEDIEAVIWNGDVIGDYPEDKRGHSCLMLGLDETARTVHDETARPVHIVCAPKTDYLAIIMAYIPTRDAWLDDFKRRKT